MADFAQTPIFKLPYPDTGGSASDNVPRDLRALALAAETALGSAGSGGTLSVTRVAGVVTQIVDTRPDGSSRLAVLRYSGDRLTSIQRFNPSLTETLTYNAAGLFTGFTTA